MVHEFQVENQKIKDVFGDEIVNVYHVGSTAIPNINAKPIIDIMVEVKNINNVDKFNSKMEQLNYEAHGEYGISKRRYISKGGNNRTHHIHIFEQGNDEIERHLHMLMNAHQRRKI